MYCIFYSKAWPFSNGVGIPGHGLPNNQSQRVGILYLIGCNYNPIFNPFHPLNFGILHIK